jgi:alkaline phosphatase D
MKPAPEVVSVAPSPRQRTDDDRPARFAFVSCQNVNQGAQNAYRRMIYEDERAPENDRLGFVLHLGDFIYEMVWYPEDRPQGMYDRHLFDIVRYPTGEKISDFHIPVTLDDYRAVYRAYLHDPDLQDARARFPFVPMWDNHEYSWLGYQSLQIFNGETRPAQTRKVAANQAWFEYQPARIKNRAAPRSSASIRHRSWMRRSNVSMRRDWATSRTTAPPSRASRLTDRYVGDATWTFSSPTSAATVRRIPRVATKRLRSGAPDFPNLVPVEVLEILDAGRAYAGGAPPASIRFGETDVPNFRRDESPHTILGAEQKKWFLERLRTSKATWKIWGNTQGTLDWRVDPQNLPPELGKTWPGAGYACFGGGDPSTAYVERAAIYDLVRDEGITGFATVCGDRHSFWAGLAAKALPPKAFEPVGVAFVTGSISAPGLVESFEHRFPKDHPLRALYLADRPGESKPQPAVNLLGHHGVRSCLEYQKTGDIEAARRLSNPDLAPHLSFLDMGGHGYATVRITRDAIESEFVCIQRPLERSSQRTAVRSSIESRIERRSGAKGRGRSWSSASSKETPSYHFRPHVRLGTSSRQSRNGGRPRRARRRSRLLLAHQHSLGRKNSNLRSRLGRRRFRTLRVALQGWSRPSTSCSDQRVACSRVPARGVP